MLKANWYLQPLDRIWSRCRSVFHKVATCKECKIIQVNCLAEVKIDSLTPIIVITISGKPLTSKDGKVGKVDKTNTFTEFVKVTDPALIRNDVITMRIMIANIQGQVIV